MIVTKEALLDLAEVVDAWRVVPRILILGYGWLVYDYTAWTKSVPDLSSGHSMVISVMWGAAAVLTGWYFQTGRRWGDN